ncbi:MAG: AtpZ/AtpI family protein [Anaerolineae bacterium]
MDAGNEQENGMDAGNEQENDLQAIIFRSLGLGTQIAGVVVVAVLGGLFLGLWIDRKLGSSPWATLLLLGLGTLVAVVGCYRVMAPVVAHLAAGQKVERRAVLAPGEFLHSLVFVAQIGLVVITPLLVGLFLGLWLDGRLDTRPWLTLTLAVVGAMGGLVGAWRLSSAFLKRMTRSDQEDL